MIKDSLFPNAPTVGVLAHEQKELACVLKNATLDTDEKLATYNQLMTKSQVLTSKAKSMFTPESTLHPQQPPPLLDETKAEERPILVRQKAKKKFSAVIPVALAKEINKVPQSYREAVKKTLPRDEHCKGFSTIASFHHKWSHGTQRQCTTLLPARPPSLTYSGLGVMLEPSTGTACRFPVTGAGPGRRHSPETYYFCNAYSS